MSALPLTRSPLHSCTPYIGGGALGAVVMVHSVHSVQ